MGDVVSSLLSFSACEVMAFPANQEFALSFGVRVGKRDGTGDWPGLAWPGLVWPGLEFIHGYSLPCIG